MSISSMLEPAVRREASLRAPEMAGRQPQADAAPAVTGPDAIDKLTQYIPTEIVTFYVALVGALHAAKASTFAHWSSFFAVLAATPVVVWLIFAAKLKARGLGLPLKPRTWPWWAFLAATIALIAWAVALPRSPFESLNWYNTIFGPIIILGVTLALALLGGVFES